MWYNHCSECLNFSILGYLRCVFLHSLNTPMFRLQPWKTRQSLKGNYIERVSFANEALFCFTSILYIFIIDLSSEFFSFFWLMLVFEMFWVKFSFFYVLHKSINNHSWYLTKRRETRPLKWYSLRGGSSATPLYSWLDCSAYFAILQLVAFLAQGDVIRGGGTATSVFMMFWFFHLVPKFLTLFNYNISEKIVSVYLWNNCMYFINLYVVFYSKTT